MELPKGTNQKIECPVVKDYNRSYKGRRPASTRPAPSTFITNVQYNSKVTLSQIQKQYVLLAIQACNGNVRQAAKLLGIGTATIYKRYLRP